MSISIVCVLIVQTVHLLETLQMHTSQQFSTYRFFLKFLPTEVKTINTNHIDFQNREPQCCFGNQNIIKRKTRKQEHLIKLRKSPL